MGGKRAVDEKLARALAHPQRIEALVFQPVARPGQLAVRPAGDAHRQRPFSFQTVVMADGKRKPGVVLNRSDPVFGKQRHGLVAEHRAQLGAGVHLPEALEMNRHHRLVLEDAGGVAVGVFFDHPAGRIRRGAGHLQFLQKGAVHPSRVAGVLKQGHRPVGKVRVQQSAVGSGAVRIIPTGGIQRLARPRGGLGAAQLVDRLLAAQVLQVELGKVVPHGKHVQVIVVKARNQGFALQVDHLRGRGLKARRSFGAAHIGDAVFADGQGVGQRVCFVEGDDVAVGENEICHLRWCPKCIGFSHATMRLIPKN